MRSLAPAAFLALGMASGVLAADCLLEQERHGSQPTGEQIAKALTSNSALDSVCSGNWRVNDEYQLNNTFNHWDLLYYVERTDKNQPLRHCQEGFNDIISQCIINGNFWGGSWSVEGETYRVSNNAYPANGLGPDDEGGNPIPSITPPPPPPSPSSTPTAGSFATTTMDIPGLRTHSATTTSADGHPTILPIWFVSIGVGIILIPGPGVPPGGLIPPPPGFPPLVIGPDGQAHTTSRDPEPSSTPSSSSAPCTVCSTCADFDILPAEVTSLLPNDGDPDLPTVDPNIWSSMATMHPTPTPPTTTDNGTPTQSAAPIDQPSCADTNEDVKKDLLMWTTRGNAIRLSDGSYHSTDDILYMLRQVICDGTCTAPSGIDSKYVAVYKKDGGACEISVAVSAQTELYVNTDMGPPDNQDHDTIWQQCWDSTQNIIDKCVANQAKAGWWNGNHQYQFYSAGVRPLNDPEAHHTKDGTSLSNYLMPTTDGLSCGEHCCGFIPNPDWCNQNCGGVSCRRGDRWSSGRAIFARATQSISRVGGCNLPYVLPDYPSSGTAQGINAVQKWYDRDNTNVGNNNCNNPRLAQFANRVPGSEYDTEHVFEKHIIKRFLHFLVGGEQAFDDSTDPTGRLPVTDCQQAENVFNQLNPAVGSDFRTETAAAQIAKAVSCKGTGCPVQDGSRDSEFFLLRKEINSFKNRIFAGHYTGVGHDDNDNKVPRCSTFPAHTQMQQAMINAALVFKYMNRQEVFVSFKAVHDRIKGILTKLDSDNMLGAAHPPLNLQAYVNSNRPNTWLTAYEEFMARFLVDTERKMGKWLHDCKESYRSKIDEVALRDNWSQQDIDDEKDKVNNYETGDGVYADGALKLDVGIWASIRGNEMT